LRLLGNYPVSTEREKVRKILVKALYFLRINKRCL